MKCTKLSQRENRHILQRHLQNPGGATSSLPVQRQIAGNEDVAPPVRLNPAQSSLQMVWLNPARSSESKFQETIVPRVIRVPHVPLRYIQSAKHKAFHLAIGKARSTLPLRRFNNRLGGAFPARLADEDAVFSGDAVAVGGFIRLEVGHQLFFDGRFLVLEFFDLQKDGHQFGKKLRVSSFNPVPDLQF